MKISYSLGSILKINEVLQCASHIASMPVQPDTIWIPETWGMEHFAMASAVSQRAQVPKIGSSIINIYSRTPALVAMGSVTMDAITNGRFVLGLGSSSKPIVENLHGQKYTSQIARMNEYVKIVRMAQQGNKLDYNGKFFSIHGFELLVKPTRQNMPIYIAAVNEKMLNLCTQIAEGVIFYLRPLSEIKETVSRIKAKKNLDIACQIITAVSDDSEKAMQRAKSTLAFYIAVGSIYREFIAKNGFKEETQAICEQYEKTGLDKLYNIVPQKMLDEFAISGTIDECRGKINKFYDAGIDQPIIQFNPVGNTIESFKLASRAFSGEQD